MKIKRIFSTLVLIVLSLVLLAPSTSHGEFAYAVDFKDSVGNDIYPYTHTFILSAYYSPLPCQNRYATGNYQSDIRLNGSGVRGADGTPVYPGMVAAPRSYEFGTKLDIPGIGITAVHDRGGAIVDANVRSNAHDRLDIWMGYGDKGLARALQWGKRTLDVTVYGKNEAIREQVLLGDYSPSEATASECGASEPAPNVSNNTVVNNNAVIEYTVDQEEVKTTDDFTADLYSGLTSDEVARLQKKLSDLNLYRAELNGKYDTVTKHAVFKFQQAQDIVVDANTIGAGVFGPKTRGRMNEILASTVYRNLQVANASLNNGGGVLN